MALATAGDCRDYLRIQHTAEDGVLALMQKSALATIRAHLRRPIFKEERTFTLDYPPYWGWPSGRLVTTLPLPISPVAATPAIVIDDGDAVTVDDADYAVDLNTGIITATEGLYFGTWPYTITATVGLETRTDYEEMVEPVLNAALLDLVADRYQRRDPGGDTAEGLPARVRAMLDPFRLVRAY